MGGERKMMSEIKEIRDLDNSTVFDDRRASLRLYAFNTTILLVLKTESASKIVMAPPAGSAMRSINE
jgi:hypothetical protein